jgi:hypothetical protein
MKNRPVGAELLHADGRTDGSDYVNSRFCNPANSPKRNEGHLGFSVSITCIKNTQVTSCISNIFNDDLSPANARNFK